MKLRARSTRIASVVAASAVVALVASAPAHAANDGVEVVNTETVQVYMSPSGDVQTQRVYEQLELRGNGEVDLRNPISTDDVRNLNGFAGVDTEDGEQVISTSVEGEKKLRSVSDFDGKLPLKVSIDYKLDGETVEPGDIVGETGSLQVQFTVENVTGRTQEVTFDDGKGGTVTKSAEVPIPIVGSLTTVAPPTFSDVTSQQANMAGDGRGGTKLSFTMTLFPPIGSTTAVFGYTADIADGVVPRVDISALPVNPLESPSFKTAAASYQGGADTGAKLTSGATQIDSNLLKLRDGAAELLAGLIKLNAGANQLSDGLSDTAVPGAHRLADGAGELRDGLGRIDDGANQLANGADRLNSGANELSSGANRLSDGASDAAAGSRKLTDGLEQIDGGLTKLADAKEGLPAAKDGIKQLQDGIALILAGFGEVNNEESLIGGLAKFGEGLGTAKTGAGDLRDGLNVLTGNVPTVSPGIKGAKGGVDLVRSGLESALMAANGPTVEGGDLAELKLGLEAVRDNFCATHPAAAAQCAGLVGQLISGVDRSRTSLGAAAIGLGQVSDGLGLAITALTGRLIPGADLLATKLGEAQAGAGKLQVGAESARGGVQQVSDGLDELAAGVSKAVSGVMQLSTGAGRAYAGSSDLSDGLGLLDAGAGELSAGAGQLADGTGQLDDGANRLAAGTGEAADGSGRIADGAGQLADGLGDAADGSGQIADGLGRAASGAPKLVDGAERLSEEGTKKLVAAGESTTQNYGEMVAVMNAGAERAKAEKMAYGAPDDAFGLTAYNYIIKGDDGEGGRNLTRGLAGIAILGAGAAVLGLRRRLI